MFIKLHECMSLINGDKKVEDVGGGGDVDCEFSISSRIYSLQLLPDTSVAKFRFTPVLTILCRV